MQFSPSASGYGGGGEVYSAGGETYGEVYGGDSGMIDGGDSAVFGEVVEPPPPPPTVTPSSPKWLGARQSSVRHGLTRGSTIADRLGIGSSKSLLGPASLPMGEFRDAGEGAEYWEQADETMHSRLAWQLRQKLRTNPLITDELTRCTYCVLPADATSDLGEKAYVTLQLALYKALVEPFNLKDATKCSKQDWSADCKGAKVMSRELLKDSIFELTDTWTRTVDPREYFSFMRTLFSAITRGDPPSLIPLDQISACTSLIDGSFDEEGNAHTAELLAAFDQAFVETDSQAKAAAEQAAAEQAEAEKRILAGLDPYASVKAALQAEMDEVGARIEELKRRQALGLLTDAERAELERLEARMQQLLGEKAALEQASEADALEKRIAELRRRQALGELTDEELAELEQLEARKTQLEAEAAELSAERQRLEEEQRQYEAFCNGSLLDDDDDDGDDDGTGDKGQGAGGSVKQDAPPRTFTRQRQLRLVRALGGAAGMRTSRKWTNAWVPVTDEHAGLAVLYVLERRAQPARVTKATEAAEVAAAEAHAAERVARMARHRAAACMADRRLVMSERGANAVVAATVSAAHAKLASMQAARLAARAMARVASAAGEPVPLETTPETFASLTAAAQDVNFGTFCLSAAPSPRPSSPWHEAYAVAGLSRSRPYSAPAGSRSRHASSKQQMPALRPTASASWVALVPLAPNVGAETSRLATSAMLSAPTPPVSRLQPPVQQEPAWQPVSPSPRTLARMAPSPPLYTKPFSATLRTYKPTSPRGRSPHAATTLARSHRPSTPDLSGWAAASYESVLSNGRPTGMRLGY